jgi:hypothetical protein
MNRANGKHLRPAAPTKSEPDPTPPPASGPHVVHPTAVYTLGQAQAALGLRPTTLKREVRRGRLRVVRRGGKYFTLGAWVLAWLSGEPPYRPESP